MLTATLLTVGALGAYLGARLTSLRLTNQQFKYVFVAMMATLLLYRLSRLLSVG
jgi:uncharacterized membrane protein YfcA